MNEKTLGMNDIPRPGSFALLSIQHLFAMFGATILVPFLTEMSPAIALISSGLGTLAFLLITRGQVPAYLGSSFAFIIPIQTLSATSAGMEGVMVGAFLSGLVYGLVAILIKATGHQWIMRILPPIVVGPVIIVIGLSLAPTAVSMAMNDPLTEKYSLLHFSAALVTLLIVITSTIFLRGFLKLIPVLIGITAGYLYSLAIGIVDFSGVAKAKFFQMPDFIIPFFDYTPTITTTIVLAMVPVAVVTLSEHIGHQLVLSKVVKKDLIEKPGLHRSIMGDGVATIIAALLGGPPNTTYGENIGVLAITRIYSVFVIGGAAILAIIFGFIGKISAFISSIPTSVMGGVSILLFGIIASSGLRMLVDRKIDFGNNRNLIISSVILVIGIGGAMIDISLPNNNHLEIHGMALAAIIGIILNLLLPGKQKYNETNMFEDEQKNDSVA